jgi:hypothetical protein
MKIFGASLLILNGSLRKYKTKLGRKAGLSRAVRANEFDNEVRYQIGKHYYGGCYVYWC